MRRARLVPLLVVLIALSGTPARAQSLADIAKKEEARRKQVPAPAKVYTNDDLRPVPSSPETKTADKAAPASEKSGDKDADKDAKAQDAAASDASGKDAAAAKDAAGKDASGKDADAQSKDKLSPGAAATVKDQAYWAGRLKPLQEQLGRDQTYADALQSRINALTTDFVNRDDPAQRNVVERDRKRAIAELDQLKKTIPLDKKAIDTFMEEARRAGVPPGWLR